MYYGGGEGRGGGCVLNLSQCGGEFQSIVAVQMSCCGLSKYLVPLSYRSVGYLVSY